MEPFIYLGRKITVEGAGAEDSPFVVKGTGYNTALAAAVESHILNLWFQDEPWHLVESRLEIGASGENLAILKIRYFSAEEELLQSEIWFDVSEAFHKTN